MLVLSVTVRGHGGWWLSDVVCWGLVIFAANMREVHFEFAPRDLVFVHISYC